MALRNSIFETTVKVEKLKKEEITGDGDSRDKVIIDFGDEYITTYPLTGVVKEEHLGKNVKVRLKISGHDKNLGFIKHNILEVLK